MGAGSAVQHPYDFSTDSQSQDNDGNEHSNSAIQSLPAWIRRKSAQNIAERGSPSQDRRPSNSDLPSVDPIRPNFLNAPLFDRHPFAEYRFQKKLGEGSFSSVYKGVLIADERVKVAVKEVNIKSLGKQQLTDLNMEVNILSQLRHESIAELYAVYTSPSKKFLIMEYLKGGELLTAICKRDHYHESDARRVMLQVASALQYMHAKKVIHRDIKPMNLILAQRTLESPIKIVDFGFATVETHDVQKPGRFLCGTPGYMAPEVLTERSYSTKVDIWGLGVVFYVLLSGYMPFSSDEQGEIHVKQGNVVFPNERFGKVSSLAKDLIRKMITVDVRERYSAHQVLQHPWMKIVDSTSTLERLTASARKHRNAVIPGSTPTSEPQDNGILYDNARNYHHRQPVVPSNSPNQSRAYTVTNSDFGHSDAAVNNDGSHFSRISNGEREAGNADENLNEEDEGDEDVEAEDVDEVGDLSGNLEWIRIYHATKSPTLAGRLWEGLRSTLSSSATSSTQRQQAVQRRQHQEILDALSQKVMDEWQHQELLRSQAEQIEVDNSSSAIVTSVTSVASKESSGSPTMPHRPSASANGSVKLCRISEHNNHSTTNEFSDDIMPVKIVDIGPSWSEDSVTVTSSRTSRSSSLNQQHRLSGNNGAALLLASSNTTVAR